MSNIEQTNVEQAKSMRDIIYTTFVADNQRLLQSEYFRLFVNSRVPSKAEMHAFDNDTVGAQARLANLIANSNPTKPEKECVHLARLYVYNQYHYGTLQ